MHDFALIFGMFAVTYSIRYLPFAYAHRISFPAWLHEALSYVPVAALTAIIAPIILYRGDVSIDISFGNEHLLTSMAAFAVAYKTRSLLSTVSSGLCIFFALKYLIT